MSTPAPIHAWPDHTVAQFHAHTPQQAGAPQTAAANDPAQPALDENDAHNPLWLIAIASGCLFAAMAALLALG